MFNKGHVPWNKGLTKETDKRIKGYTPWSKGLNKETDERIKEMGIKISKTNKGHIVTEETKSKLRITNKGQISWSKGLTKKTDERVAKMCNARIGHLTSQETKDKISQALKGHFVTDETKKKISESHKGEKSYRWEGGISFEPYSMKFNRELKELIRNRDGYQCQLCGLPECESIEKLSIHHIDYDKKNSLPNNLITLCRSCHSKVNINREKWEIYFKKKIEKIMNQNKIQLNFDFNTKKEEGKVIETSFQL